MANYATVLRKHVTLKCRSLDRLFLQGYVPKLQSVGQVCKFLRWQRGFPIPSSAAFGRIGDRYTREIEKFAEKQGIPLVHFKKGDTKEDIARPYLEAAAREGKQRVVLIGIGQEKASIWRSWKAKGQEKAAHPHMEWGRQMAFINHYYFYIWDEDWGPTFWKTNAYAPFSIWLWLNGHEWAKRQLDKAAIPYEALDNGFRSCENPRALQRICHRLGPKMVLSYFWRWYWCLPSPFTAEDVKAGYVYEFAFRQFEVSETLVFDRPDAGRAWFEGVIRDHLDIGRPEQVVLLFDRRLTSRTQTRWRTRVLCKGVDPILTCYYKSSRLKQYFKEGRALRTETVICDTHDFGIGRRVCAKNWYALRDVGHAANRRLCDAEMQDARPAPEVATFEQVTRPSLTDDGQPASAIRFGDPRMMAVLAALVGFCHLFAGFRNRDLVERTRALLDRPYEPRHATYDLRRLRRKGLITRQAQAHRYQLTPLGRRVAVLFTKTYGRVLTPGLATLDPALPSTLAARDPLALAWQRFDRQLEDYCQRALIAA